MDLERRKAMGRMVSQGAQSSVRGFRDCGVLNLVLVAYREVPTDHYQELPPLDGSASGLVLM